MKNKWTIIGSIVAVLLLALAGGLARAQGPRPPGVVGVQAALGNAFTYQGQLKKDGNPYNGTCDFQFSLWDAASGGTQVGTTQTKTGITVSNGLFTVQLDFGAGVFQGDARWLAIAVRCPAGSDTYTPLTPRQPLTAAPYALFSKAAPWSGLTGVPTGFADEVDNDTTYTAGIGLTLTGNQFSVNTAYTDGRYWMLGGNSLSAEGNLGLANNYALNFLVNNQRALRLEPNSPSPNLIGGYSGNSVGAGVVGAVIGGGGHASGVNSVTADYGTVGGGQSNQASGEGATVGGGYLNTADNGTATVGGGYGNTASGLDATVAGGDGNTASGTYATVPGGKQASASLHGQMAYASGSFANVGDAQTSVYVLRNTTSDATLTELFLDGNSSRLTIASGRTLVFDILVVGRSTDGESAGYRVYGVIENVDGTTALVGSVTKTNLGEDDTAWEVTVDADDADNALRIRVQGNTGDSVRWVATVRTVEVQQ